jgi:hypothetical protein
MSQVAAQLLRDQRALEETTVRRRERMGVMSEGAGAIRRTAPPYDARLEVIVKGYTATRQVHDSLVALRCAGRIASRDVVVPAGGARLAIDHSRTDADLLHVRWEKEASFLLTALGQVWQGRLDGTDRIRIVAASNVVFDEEAVAVAWGDETAPGARYLEIVDLVLGPEARRRLVDAEGRDAAFLAWLRGAYGASVVAAFEAKARKIDKDVERLVQALRAEAGATGFVVLDGGGRMLGAELFASTALMLDMAPRLLRGYLLEAGDAIRVTPARAGATDAANRIQEMVQAALDDFPQRPIRIEETTKGSLDRRTELGIRQITLRTSNRVVGHGLIDRSGPIHLSLFE